MIEEKLSDLRWHYLWAIVDFNVKDKPAGYNDKIWDKRINWAGYPPSRDPKL